MKTNGKIESKKGFYVGDICYVLADDVYHGVWGGAGYEDGIYTDTASGMQFAVAGTAYGDGTYFADNLGCAFPVDAGNIGIVPLEIVDERKSADGFISKCPGVAEFDAENGVFEVTLPDGTYLYIDTADEGGC